MSNKRIYLKLIVIFLIYLFIFVLFSFKEDYCKLAQDEEYIGTKIPITVTLSGNPADDETVFKYEIKPDIDNPGGAIGEIQEITISVKKDDQRNLDGSITKTVDLDFSEVIYPKEGIYGYTISEIYCSNEKEYPLSNQQYQFYIEAYKEENMLKHSIFRLVNDLYNKSKDDKVVFNHNQMTYFKIKLLTRGRLANSDEYFRLTVSVFGSQGETYNIEGQDSIIAYEGKNIKTLDSFKIGKEKYSFDIYMKNGQEINIGRIDANGKEVYQIPVGTYVSIIENDARKYQTFINTKEGKVIRNFNLSSNDEENVFEFLNQAEFDVAITGTYIAILPYIILSLVAIIMIFVIIYKNQKEKSENEVI